MKGLSIFIIVLCILVILAAFVLPVIARIWARTIRKISKRGE